MTKVYAIQVSGISCINCANNIKVVLAKSVEDGSLIVNVNVMQEKVYLTTNCPETPQRVIDVLKETKYFPINEPVLLSGAQENHRSIGFLIDPLKKGDLEGKLASLVGVLAVKCSEKAEKVKVSIEYNCHMLKGR